MEISPPEVPSPPPWQPMPTRIPLPTPTSEATGPLQTLQAQLQVGRPGRVAEIAWETAREKEPENAVIWREGARLALARDDFSLAEARIWQAIATNPQDAESWALLATILSRQGALDTAEQALGIAQTLTQEQMTALFLERWHSALAAQNSATLQTLAQTYSRQNPRDELKTYYQAEALLTINAAQTARDLLLQSTDSQSPAVLWYTLGRAYMQSKAWPEAVIALEVANNKLLQGDESLALASRTPQDTLSITMAQAYLYAGKCIQAERLFKVLSTPHPELAPQVREAIICQTPTPTWTPWIISQQEKPATVVP